MKKYYLSLAAEYRVTSELLIRGLDACVTFGNMKAADVVVWGQNRQVKLIEVKASQRGRFVTNFYQKFKTKKQQHPNFWVLVDIDVKDCRFFVLSHSELANIQANRNIARRVARGTMVAGEKMTWNEMHKLVKNGVDNVLTADVETYENKWEKIYK